MKREAARKVTIREVAALAGVSIGSVSRALNRAGRVSAATIMAVEAAAKRLGYEPDATAQSMRTRSIGVVGLLVADLASAHTMSIVAAIESRLQAEGYALLLGNTHDDPRRERTMIDFFRRRRVDGIMLAACGPERPEVLDSLRARGVPAVAIDRDLRPEDTGVQVDFMGGALQATRYLLGLGHRRIALLTTGDTRRPGRERISGYRDAYAERGLRPDAKLIRVDPVSRDFSLSAALGMLSSDSPPTAFFCPGTHTLVGVLHAIRHSGLAVPDDVSVISVGDSHLSQLYSPAVTSLTWDFTAVGTVVSELMLKRLRASQGEPILEPERIVMGMQLVMRGSCGPAALASRRGASSTIAA